MAKQSGKERNAGLEAARISLALEALEQRILLSNPGIGYLADSPDPVHQGSNLTLVAHNVLDPDGDPIANVQFYRSVDNVANPLTDTLLGAGTAIAGNDWIYTGTASWASGNWYYFAIAQDPAGHFSNAALTSGRVNALPLIGSLTGSPQPTGPGSNITLTATGVSDTDGTVSWVDFYHDANGNGTWDAADTFLGRDTDGQNGWKQSVLVQWSTGDYFARSRDNNNGFSAFITGHVDQRPVIVSLQNNPNPSVPGQFLTLTASGVSDPDGFVQQVTFYRDADGNGALDTSKDQLLGSGFDAGGGTWQLIVMDDWQPGITPLYFAIPTDNEGYQGFPVQTLNQNPTVDGISSDQTAITLGSNLNLEALGVADSDGYVHDVVFSVTSPPDWWPYNASPTAQSQDSTLADGWTWDNIGVDWSVTDIAQADFNNDGYADLAVTVNVTSGGGFDFVAIMTNDGNAHFTTTSVIDLFDPTLGMNYNPSAVATGDFNEDGFQDIAVINPGAAAPNRVGHVAILMNDGTGLFGGHTDYSANFTGDRYTMRPDSLAVGDYTGDGNLDIVGYSSAQGEMPLWVGDGAGTFALNRIYSYGSSRWIGGNPAFLAGTGAPPATLGIQDMLSTDLDQHEDGGADVAMVGQNGVLALFDYIRNLDTTVPLPNDFDIFGPGNVIGRAIETGITGGVPRAVSFHYTYRTGTTWTREDLRNDSYWHLRTSDGTDGGVDMFHVALNAGQTLTFTPTLLFGPDSTGSSVYAYIYDATGAVVLGGPLDPPLVSGTAYTYTATAAGDYYLTIAGVQLVSSSDTVDPFTGYWVLDDSLPSAGTDVEYDLALEVDAVGAVRTAAGRGDSISAADFMEDDFNNNAGLLLGTDLLQDTDLATSNSVTGNVAVMFGNRYNGINDRLAYGSFYADYDVYSLGGRMPTAIAAYNIDSDTLRNTDSGPDWDWAQGSTGEFGDASEQYNDLVTVNTDGTMSILINTGDYSANFGIHEFAYTATFNGTEGGTGRPLNYALDNNPVGDPLQGPLQSPLGIVVGDFNGDGLATFAVAEKYDVAVLNQAFPFHNSDPLDLNQYEDEVPQIGLPFDASGRYSVLQLEAGQRPVTYYATAFDNDYGYPYNLQYQGYSMPTALTLALNQKPVIWSLTSDRDRLAVGDDLTLTANIAQDLDGFVAEVNFYLYDGVGALDPTQDALLGVDRNAGDGWSFVGTLGATTDIFYAVAVDNDGASGLPVAAHVNIDPTIAALYVDGVYNAGDDTLIVGTAPAPGALGIRPVQVAGVNAVMFNDVNNNGRWDTGEDLWQDQNGDGAYNEESKIYLGTGGWDTAVGALGTSGTAIFQDSNHDGLFEWNEALWIDANVNGEYDLGETLRNAGTGVLQVGDPGIAGNVYLSPTDGEIWSDAINNPADIAGRYDGIQETQLYSGGDGWQTRDATVGTIGNLLFRDSNGNGIRNGTEGIWAEQVEQGQTISLIAVDVATGTWATGAVRKVEFYLDADYDGNFNPDTDLFLGRGVNIGNTRGGAASEWRLMLWVTNPVTLISSSELPVVSWDPGTRTYFAVAQDAADNWSAEAAASDEVVNLPPLITSLVDSPDPVTQGQNITLTGVGVEDQFGQVNNVAFYLDSTTGGTPGVIDPADRLLGIDQSPGGGWRLTALVDWGGGLQTYMARVSDNYGATADAVTTGTVNLPPIIDSLTGNPEPVVQGQTLTLQAINVHDQDGNNIVNVEFYRDSNANGSLDVGVDQRLSNAFVTYLGVLPDKSGDWRWQGAATFPIGNQLYFARAQDSRGGWSDTAGLSGRVQNAPPTIASLNLAPNPVTQGSNLTLTAQTVVDSNGSVTKVEFYRDTNANGSLDPASDALLGTVNFSATQNYVLVQPVTWAEGLQLYFARAQDNEGAWSLTAFAQGTVNGRPAIGDFTADPSPLVPGDVLTLTAANITDADGTIAQVSFYRDTNGDGIFEVAQDGFLGTDADGSDGWSVSLAETTAIRRFFAIARDNVGGDSLPASVDVHRRPTIEALSAFPNPVTEQQMLVLTAINANDIDGSIDSIEFYRDADSDGLFNPVLDQLLGTDTTSGDGWSVAVSPTWGGGTARFFARARDNEGDFSLDAYAPTATTYVDFSPEISILDVLPNPVNRGENLTLTAMGVTDADGTIAEVNFYNDLDGDGLLDPTVDQFLGRDISAVGGWKVVVSTTGWPLGSTTFFAQAFDNLGASSDPASAPGRVNGVPLMVGLQATPNPVVRGNFLTLTGVGVTDLDGFVSEVRFYRDTNGNGTWDGADALLGTDTIGTDGWQLPVATGPLVPGAYTFFARPVDDDGAVGLPVSTGATVTTAPSLVIAMQPGSDTGVSMTDGITNDTTPTFDFFVNDVGTIQIDWNNDTIFDQSIVTGGAGTYSVTAPAYAAGSHTVAARFTDYAAHVTNGTDTFTIDITAPAAPAAPDLQAASDNGLLDWDSVTSLLAPVFDVATTPDYFRFFRGGVQVSGDYETGTTFSPGLQAIGTFNFAVRAVDAAGNVSALSPVLPVTFTARPATPAAPDLQPGSDSGISNTDNLTNVLMPVFNVTSGLAPNYTVRLWRGTALVNSLLNATAIADVTGAGAADGTYDYTITVLNAAGQESLHSAPLAVTIDRTPPTVTDPNINVFLSIDNGVKGVAELGDTVTITWNNSASGDDNPDVASVAVDLSQYSVGGGPATMFDDGTHGDSTAGDDIWTLNYTIVESQILSRSLNVRILATDNAANVGTGDDTSGIRVKPKLIAERAWQGFDVAIYDVDGNSDFTPQDVVINMGTGNVIKSIVIGGTRSAEGLGIAISGATSVGPITDVRKGPLGSIAFIASTTPIKSIQLKSSMQGYNLNDQLFGSIHFAADIDGDGDANDNTAIYVNGAVGTTKIAGSVMADVWLGGAGTNFTTFQTTGSFRGDLTSLGSAGNLLIGGSLGSGVSVQGSLQNLTVSGNMLAGAHVFVRNQLTSLTVGGSLLGAAPEDQNVQILAGAISKGTIAGSVNYSRILAGANLGADWAVGGSGANADTFNVGQIGTLTVNGSVFDSLIGAGLISNAGGFDLAWLDANNAFLNGSAINKLTIKGSLTSDAGVGAPYGVGSYRVISATVGGNANHPLVFREV